MCDDWYSFERFFKDMGEAPNGYSIERIDVNGNYELKNCKWIPHNEQYKNKRLPSGYNFRKEYKIKGVLK